MAVVKPSFGDYQYVWDLIMDGIAIVGAGEPWPEGDEDKLWALSEAWTKLADAVEEAIGEADPAALDVLNSWGGEAGLALQQYWNKVGVSPSTGLPAIQRYAAGLAAGTDSAAMELQYAKLTIIISVIITVISVFIALLMAWLSFGASTAAIGPIIAGGRHAVWLALRQLLTQLGRKLITVEGRKLLGKQLLTKVAPQLAFEIVEEVVEEVILIDLGAQWLQNQMGTRDGYDWKKTQASLYGSVIGAPLGMAVAGPMRFGRRGAQNALARTTGRTFNSNAFSRFGRDALDAGLNNAITSPVSSAIANGLVYGDWRMPSLTDALNAGIAGGARARSVGPAGWPNAAYTLANGLGGSNSNVNTGAPGLDTNGAQAPTVGSDTSGARDTSGTSDTQGVPGSTGDSDTAGSTGRGDTSADPDASGVPVSTDGQRSVDTQGSTATAPSSSESTEDTAPAGTRESNTSPVAQALAPDAHVPAAPSGSDTGAAPTQTGGPPNGHGTTATPDSPGGTRDSGPATSSTPNQPAALPGEPGRGAADAAPASPNGHGPAVDPTAPAETDTQGGQPPVAPPVGAPVGAAPPGATGPAGVAAGPGTTAPSGTTAPGTQPGTTAPGTQPGTAQQPASSQQPATGQTTRGSQAPAAVNPTGPQARTETSTPQRSTPDTRRADDRAPADSDQRAHPRQATDPSQRVDPVQDTEPGKRVDPVLLPSGRDTAPAQDGTSRPRPDSPSDQRGPADSSPPRSPGATPDTGQSRTPMPRSQTPTAQGTYSYSQPSRQFDGDPNSEEAARALADASRGLADAVREEVTSEGWTNRRRDAEAPTMSGALMTPDGTIHAHTSIKTDERTNADPNWHPLLKTILDEVADQIRYDGGVVGVGHGFCAEVAIISDVLFSLEAQFNGDPAGFRAHAVRSLTGSTMTTHQIRKSEKSHGTYRPPCSSCGPTLQVLGIGAVVDPGQVAVPTPAQDRTTAPGPLSTVQDSRPYGQDGGLAPASSQDQQAVADSVPRNDDGTPQRHPDPRRGTWFGLLNDGGPSATPFRANNCLDTTLSFLTTWFGNPQVSAPRSPEFGPDGTASRSGEQNGSARAEQVLGAGFQNRGSGSAAFDAIADQLRAAGHGAAAAIITQLSPDRAGGAHSWNAVNHNGTILWVDAQTGRVSENPIWQDSVVGVWSVTLDANGNAITEASTAPAETRPDAPATQDGQQESGQPPLDPQAEEQRILDQLSPDERATLDHAVNSARPVAERVMDDLQSIAALINGGLPTGEAMGLLGSEHRVKGLASLGRKFVDESGRFGDLTATQFLSGVNDLIRFSLRTPDGAAYGPTVSAVLGELVARGYQLDAQRGVKNFWKQGNRFYGLNATVTAPDGQAFELQFPTESSWRAGKLTHKLYEQFRLPDATPQAQVRAFLEILRINKEHGLDRTQPGQDGLPPAKGASFADWMIREPDAWSDYQVWLQQTGTTFADVLSGAGLTPSDVPGVDVGAIPTMERGHDVRLLRPVQDGHERAAGRPDRPGAFHGSASRGDVESPGEGVDIRSRVGGADAVRRPELRPVREGGPGEGGGDRADVGDGAAERGGAAPDLRGGRSGPRDHELTSAENGLLRTVQGDDQRAAGGADRGGTVDGTVPGGHVEPQVDGLDVQSGDRGSAAVRRPDRGSVPTSGPSEGRGDRADVRDGAAERGGAAPDLRGGHEGEVAATGIGDALRGNSPTPSPDTDSQAGTPNASPYSQDGPGQYTRSVWQRVAGLFTGSTTTSEQAPTSERQAYLDNIADRREQVDHELNRPAAQVAAQARALGQQAAQRQEQVRLAQADAELARQRSAALTGQAQQVQAQIQQAQADADRASTWANWAHAQAQQFAQSGETQRANQAWSQAVQAQDQATRLATWATQSQQTVQQLLFDAQQAAALERQQRSWAAEQQRQTEHLLAQSQAAEAHAEQLRNQAQAIAENLATSRPDMWRWVNQDNGDLMQDDQPEATVSALTGHGYPPSADQFRPYDRPGGLRRPRLAAQRALEGVLPRNPDGSFLRAPDPRQGWVPALNDVGLNLDPTRGVNCVDAVLSFFETFVHGRPRVAAPRSYDGYSSGNVRRPLMGENGGAARAENITGARYQGLFRGGSDTTAEQRANGVRDAYATLEDQLRRGGHGSFAIISTDWVGGGAHVWVAVNYGNTIIYVDPQTSQVSDSGPIYAPDTIAAIETLAVDRNGQPMPFAQRPMGRWNVLAPTPAYTANLPTTTPAPTRTTARAPVPTLPVQSQHDWRLQPSAPPPEQSRGQSQGVIRSALRRVAAMFGGSDAAPRPDRPGPEAAARLAERRHLVGEFYAATTLFDAEAIRREIAVLDQSLARLGQRTDGLTQLPAAPQPTPRPAPVIPTPATPVTPAPVTPTPATPARTAPAPSWIQDGRQPDLDELIPRTNERAENWGPAIEEALAARLTGTDFAGLRTRISSVDVFRNSLTVRLDVLHPDFGVVGSTTRVFSREHDGTLYVEHISLRMDRRMQGTGFAQAWNNHLEQWYSASGVDRIEIHAASTVGGYAWARAGYDWAPNTEHRSSACLARLRAEQRLLDEAAEQLRQFLAGDQTVDVTALQETHGITDPQQLLDELTRQSEAAQSVLDRARQHPFGTDGYPTPFEISNVGWNGRRGSDATWVGKRAMLGSDWKGVKPIPRPEQATPDQQAGQPPTQDGGLPAPDGLPADLQARYDSFQDQRAREQFHQAHDRVSGDAARLRTMLEGMERGAARNQQTLEDLLVERRQAFLDKAAAVRPPSADLVAAIDELLDTAADALARIDEFERNNPGVRGTNEWRGRFSTDQNELSRQRVNGKDVTLDRIRTRARSMRGTIAEIALAERSTDVVAVSKIVTAVAPDGSQLKTDADVVADGGRAWLDSKDYAPFGLGSFDATHLREQATRQLTIVAFGAHPDGVPRLEWHFPRGVDPGVAAMLEGLRVTDPRTGAPLPHPRLTVVGERISYHEARTGGGAQAGGPPVDGDAQAGGPPPDRSLPSDGTGYQIQQRDLDFLGITDEQFGWWADRSAPLGMTPEQYVEFRLTLLEALQAEGVSPDEVDIRLKGSSAEFFSGIHKTLFTEDNLAGNPDALARLAEWFGDDQNRPTRRPFDAHHKLGIEEPSDYDLNISCSRLVEVARVLWESGRYDGEFIQGHGYVKKTVMADALPTLQQWSDHWSTVLGRDVSHAIFVSDGPYDTSQVGTGISVHFRDTDWTVHRPGDAVPARPPHDPLYPSGWRRFVNFGYDDWDEWPEGIPGPPLEPPSE